MISTKIHKKEKIMSELEAIFQIRDEENHLLENECTEVMGKFDALHASIMKDGTISKKNKSLVALGIAICVRCEGCMLSHVESALKQGASLEEIAETVEVAILMGGGPSTVFGRRAIKAAKELLAIGSK